MLSLYLEQNVLVFKWANAQTHTYNNFDYLHFPDDLFFLPETKKKHYRNTLKFSLFLVKFLRIQLVLFIP